MRTAVFLFIVLLLSFVLCISAELRSNTSNDKQLKHIAKKINIIRERLNRKHVLSKNDLDKSIKELNNLIKKAQGIRKKERTVLVTPKNFEAMSEINYGATLRTKTDLNVRSGPCTSYSIVKVLSAGQTATFSGRVESGCGYSWYSISGGWVASNFVEVVTMSGGGGSSSGSLTVDQLRKIMPKLPVSKANDYIGHLNNAMSWASINTCLRKSAFLAQLAEESDQLYYFEEIASGDAYEGRKDLGNIYPGDGRRYKGRGPIQLTGRSSYRAAGRDLGVDLEGNPTLVATAPWGFKVAGWYWKTRSLNQYADQGTQGGFDEVTRRINGGYNGKADRDNYWRKARSVLGC